MKYPFYKTLVLATLLMPLVLSCQDDNFTIGTDFIRSGLYTELIDSVTIEVSTIKPDSLQTSGQNIALVGSYGLKGLGLTEATSYLSFTNSDISVFEEHEIYDSLTLVLTYSGFSAGDTLKPFTLGVYRLSEPLHYKTEYSEKDTTYYNTTQKSYANEALALLSFYPTPSTKGQIEVKLPNSLGKELLGYVNDEIEPYIFLQKFKGLAIKPLPNKANAMLGFTVNDTASVALKLYSHINLEEKKEKERKFKISSTTYQFNNIESTPTLPGLTTLSPAKLWVNESETDHCGFIQGGIGYSVRVDFPYLNRLQELKSSGRIIKAVLLLYPDMSYQSLSMLPSEINAAPINKINDLGSNLTDSYGNTQTGYLQTDPIDMEENYYTFDITSYINNRLASEDVILPDKGLSIDLPTDKQITTTTSLVIGGYNNKNYKSKLNIYYYGYDL
jgi:hypothetical protein